MSCKISGLVSGDFVRIFLNIRNIFILNTYLMFSCIAVSDLICNSNLILFICVIYYFQNCMTVNAFHLLHKDS